MTTGVGAGQSADDINAVADPTWLSRLRTETGAEPFLGDDGAVVIQVISGSGPVLDGAPPDRTIKLPSLGAHQARVAVRLGSSSLQRVIIDAHERLEEISIAAGHINDLTINATQWGRALKLTGEVDVGTLRLRGGSLAVLPLLIRPTTVIDLRGTGVEIIGDTEGAPLKLLLGGYVGFRSSWRVQSSHVAPGTLIDGSTSMLRLGIVNMQQGGDDPPLEMTLCSTGWVVCEYLPPATSVHLERGSLQLDRPTASSSALPL
jgi:hypothetical protein